MNEIKLMVDDENLETLEMILNNLKSGLIVTMSINDASKKIQSPQYKLPRKNVIYEHESGTNDSTGKYLSPNAYKNRFKK